MKHYDCQTELYSMLCTCMIKFPPNSKVSFSVVHAYVSLSQTVASFIRHT